ncbi:MJ0042-type zinc finger domain-containing protein [Bradyrhizobium sp. SYSU BS000235]|uniref:MJ0042-type zinc finger domain-containing protein n=1 Tax=Bradyrhizobium sp. SYSU BS000235 TaxID=3411332 RepID=UPI003C77911C
MHIVCPHCTTSYAVDAANFTDAGRRVRCARCGEVWVAKPQEMAASAPMAAQDLRMQGSAAQDLPPQGTAAAPPETDFGSAATSAGADWQNHDAPHVESPSISADWPEPEAAPPADGTNGDWPAEAQQDGAAVHDDQAIAPKKAGRMPSLKMRGNWARRLPTASALPTLCVALAAITFALIAWRGEVVRLMPQTADFFKLTGLGVNLRGLSIEGVKVSSEIVDNKPVLLIEGAIVDVTRKTTEIPRLRFIVRNAKGADIYAWTTVLEQPVLHPGEKAWFKTRLASPPAEGREIAVRFFHKRDLAAGGM